MKKKKILVITGTRAEYGLLKPLLFLINSSSKLKLELLVTGMHVLDKFGNSLKEIRKDFTNIDAIVKINKLGRPLSWLCEEIIGIEKYCKKNMPDVIVVLGDRDEPFAASIVAGHLGIPLAHIHGGEVTGHIPDQFIRNSITQFAQIHFTATKNCFNNVVKLGVNSKKIFNVGAIGLDELNKLVYINRKKLAKKYCLNINKKWLLIVLHPTPDKNFSFVRQITSVLNAVREIDAEKVIVYPNSDIGSEVFIKEINKYQNKDLVHIFKNLPHLSYLSFLKEADCLIGNSSSGIIEAPFFKLPVLNVGLRQSGREKAANIIDVSYNKLLIKNKIEKFIAVDRNKIKVRQFYGSGNTAKKIVKILEQTNIL